MDLFIALMLYIVAVILGCWMLDELCGFAQWRRDRDQWHRNVLHKGKR